MPSVRMPAAMDQHTARTGSNKHNGSPASAAPAPPTVVDIAWHQILKNR